MRRRRADGNHAALRAAWRALGGSWLDLVPERGGVPDALVGWRGADRLIEVKPPDGTAAQRRLRPPQARWHGRWRGRPPVRVETLAEIVALFP
jgi:hypothetical protein